MAEATLEAIIKADASGFYRTVEGVKGAMGGLSSLLQGLGVGGFLAGALKEASDAEDGFAQLNAVLKSTKGIAGVTAEDMIGLAGSLQQVTRFSDDTVLATGNMLLTFTKISKDIMPEATETVLDMSQALGQDTKNSAIQLGKALNDPIDGITALRRVGVTFSNEQERMIKQLVRSGRMMDAQQVILSELRTEFGGSAKAAGQTFGGMIDIARNKVSDLMESIGNSLTPVVKLIVPIFGEFVDSLQPLAPVLAGIGVAMGAVVLATSPLIASLMPILVPIAAITGGVALLRQAWETDFGGLRTSVTGFVATIQPELNKLRDLFGNFMSILTTGESPIAAIAEFDRAGSAIEQQSAMVRTGLEGFASDKIKKKPMMFGDRLSKAVEETWPAIKTALDSLGAKIGNWLETDVFPKVGQRIINTLAPSLMSAFATGIGGLDIGKIFDEATKKGAGQKEGAPAGPDTAKAVLSPITKSIEAHGSGIFLEALSPALSTALNGLNVEGWAKGDGTKMFGTAFEHLADVAGKELSTIAGAITSAVSKGLQDILRAIGGNLSFIPGMGAVSAAIEATIKKLDGKAGGGSVTGGTPYMVGEQGRELFVPSTSGRIVPNSDLRGSSGGNISIQNMTIYGVQDVDGMYVAIRQKAKSMNRPLAGAM